ncbi:MAG: pantoate--beta-alanine ligase [Wenzhouxiangella sp.]
MPAVAEHLDELRGRIERWRNAGGRIGLVPTMGNLHAGHLALVDVARKRCDRTVVSIFVNPTQFGPGEDYDSYPRTRDADLAALERAGCDLAWMPTVSGMYPLDEPFRVAVPDSLTDCLCGRSRPGHFDGVATVVIRLFNQVRPDRAVFGEKDYQQLVIIRRMVRDLALPIVIDGVQTMREADGLAMSSRNGYLDAGQREAAPALYQVLSETAERLSAGESFARLRPEGLARLQAAGFEPEYLEWRSAEDLGPPRAGAPSRLFGAARLGRARLIDNVPVV